MHKRTTVVISASDKSEERVEHMRDDILASLDKFHADILTVAYGDGFWQGRKDGEAVMVLAIVDTASAFALRTAIRDVAESHGQDAIGFVTESGDDNLVWAR